MSVNYQMILSVIQHLAGFSFFLCSTGTRA